MKHLIIIEGRVASRFNEEQQALSWLEDELNTSRHPTAWYASIDTESNEDEYYIINETNKSVSFDSDIKDDIERKKRWRAQIAATDADMPRWMEDHIESAHNGVADNPYQQGKYDAKKLLRSQKPRKD